MRSFLVSNLTALLLTISASADPLIRVGDNWRYSIAHEALTEPGDLWRQPQFDDSQWLEGPSGFYSGFGVVPEATPVFGLGSNGNTALFRKRFTVEDPSLITWLILRIDFQHGFAAYLNGEPLVQRQLTSEWTQEIPFDRSADPHFSGTAIEIDLSRYKDRLKAGENLLAVQVHGGTLTSSSMTFNAELLSNFTRGPFIQQLTSTSTKIVWGTHQASIGSINYGPTEELTSSASSRIANTEHVIHLENLSPDTRYHYRIVAESSGDLGRSKIYSFRTMKENGPLRFAMLADSGKGTVAQYEIAKRLREWAPDLVLHGGDVVYPDFTAGRADLRAFSVYGSDMAERPYFFAAGNHDVNHGLGPFLEAFHHPTNNTPQILHDLEGTAPELYYSFDQGDAHFTVLYMPFFSQYVFKKDNPQYQWLEQDLQQSNKPWKVLMLHHNVFSSSAHTFDDWDRNGLIDQEELQALLIPLAKQYGVQIIFTGHDHVFERFTPTDGIHFVTSAGGGGGLYSLARRLPGSAQFWRNYHFVGITIDDTELTMEAIGPTGNVFDHMYLRKEGPTEPIYEAAWNSVGVEAIPGSVSTDGNIPGQTYDLVGKGVTSIAGQQSNLGRLTVNLDRDFIFLGLESTMLRPHQLIYLFIETESNSSPSSLPLETNSPEVGNPARLQALALTEGLSFQDFNPNIICLLGDEYADISAPSFRRPSSLVSVGQGVFSFDETGRAVAEARLQQFDHSPLTHNKPNEQNSNLIEIALPKSLLSPLSADSIKIAAIVGSIDELSIPPQIHFDTGYIGTKFEQNLEPKHLSPITFQLASNPDQDFDGIPNDEENQHGTDPRNPDTDGDQLPDGWELTFKLSPLVALGTDGKDGDPDQDAVSNLNEYLAGTNPQDPVSRLTLSAEHLGSGIVRVSWHGNPHIHYTLEVSTDGMTPFTPIKEWTERPGNESFPIEHFDRGEPNDSRFFRLQARRVRQ